MKRLKIYPKDASEIVVLKSLINSKFAELEVLKNSEVILQESIKILQTTLPTEDVPVDHLNMLLIEKQRLQVVIQSLQAAMGPELEWEDVSDTVRDADQLNSIFHRLWTKSVGKIGYDKKEWLQLQKLLLKQGIVT